MYMPNTGLLVRKHRGVLRRLPYSYSPPTYFCVFYFRLHFPRKTRWPLGHRTRRTAGVDRPGAVGRLCQ
jgi:hypothetical protein